MIAIIIILIVVVVFVIYTYNKGKRLLQEKQNMENSLREVKNMQMQNLANRPELNIDENLKQLIREKKRFLAPGDVLIKNRLEKDIMQVKYSKWQEIQSQFDANLWDRLDDKI
jgi:hypothetical protein